MDLGGESSTTDVVDEVVRRLALELDDTLLSPDEQLGQGPTSVPIARLYRKIGQVDPQVSETTERDIRETTQDVSNRETR